MIKLICPKCGSTYKVSVKDINKRIEKGYWDFSCRRGCLNGHGNAKYMIVYEGNYNE